MRDDLAAMRRYAHVLTRHREDSDDIVQDALVRAIERQATYDPQRSRRRWLLAIVHNVFISAKRRETAEAQRNIRFAQTLLSQVDPEQEQMARLNEVARSFAALPDGQRAVLQLVAVEGMSYQEAADILDVPIGTVMSRLSRARSAIRERDTSPQLRIVGGRDDE
jgi:RNA polymerase sigma-70 factor (ECF subfamily)